MRLSPAVLHGALGAYFRAVVACFFCSAGFPFFVGSFHFPLICLQSNNWIVCLARLRGPTHHYSATLDSVSMCSIPFRGCSESIFTNGLFQHTSIIQAPLLVLLQNLQASWLMSSPASRPDSWAAATSGVRHNVWISKLCSRSRSSSAK
jgi:hypothetical protein